MTQFNDRCSLPLNLLADALDIFLEKWPAKVKQTGYLGSTTAIREDWAQAFEGIVPQILALSRDGKLPQFAELVGKNADKQWSEFVVREARRHRHRGVTAEMFLVCFKCLVHALEEIIRESDVPAEDRLPAVAALRAFLDAMECRFVGDWTASLQDDMLRSLQETNRLLTLEKNNYESIFEATSDLVLVTDGHGCIVEANSAAKKQFQDRTIFGTGFWELLGLEGADIHEVLKYYPMDQTHEISLDNETRFFIVKITYFSKILQDTAGYMLLLNDITCQVDKRERLEQLVQKRNLDLTNREIRFRALFQAAGEGILLIDDGMRIVEANERACSIFDYPAEELVGGECGRLTDNAGYQLLRGTVESLSEDQIWTGELNGRRGKAERFPLEVTITRVELEGDSFFHLIMKDISRRKALEASLRIEKQKMVEMNVTLRNIMEAIGREKQMMEKGIAGKIKTLLLPTIEKIRREPNREMRENYLNIVQGQLLSLTRTGIDEYEPRFLRLSRTENTICQLIQAGLSSKEIAENLKISHETIQTHRKNIRRKLGLQGRGVNLFNFLSRRGTGKVDRV